MNSKFIIFYVVTAACVSRSAAEDVDCTKRPNFVHPKTCCPIPDFFTDEIKEKCQEFDEPSPPPLPMSAELSEESDEPSPRPRPRPPHHHHNHHHHHHHPCFIQCSLNETEIRDANGSLDEAKMQEYVAIMLQDVPEMIPIMEESLKTCAAKSAAWKAQMAQKSTRPTTATDDRMQRPRCGPCAAMLLGCAYMETFKNCPTSVWNDTQECNESREYFNSCKSKHMWGKHRRGSESPNSEENELLNNSSNE